MKSSLRGSPPENVSEVIQKPLIGACWPDTSHLLSQSVLDNIARRARDSDSEGRAAAESIEELKASGYFGLPVPSDFGGLNATVTQCCALQRLLARADPGLAIALNMHLFSVGMIVEHWVKHHDSSWMLLEAIATQGRLVASAFAEPGLGGAILRSNHIARKVDKGYVVSGVKTPCSLAERCDLICLQMIDESSGELMIALIPHRADGIKVKRSWDTLGMRASESDTIILENCFIPDQLIFHRCSPGFDSDEVFEAGLAWFCLTTAAIYIGLIEEAIQQSAELLQNSRVEYLDASRAELPSFQAGLGELAANVSVLANSCLRITELLDSRVATTREVLLQALSIKHVVVGLCDKLVGEAMELAGAQSYQRKYDLERLWRDSQAARFHPPTRVATRQIIGKWVLGMPYTFELSETPG